jgi:PAS domain S-box-containing protein
MSDHGTADPRSDEVPPRAVRLPHPMAMIVVDVVTGTVTAANPAGRRRLSGQAGLELSHWVADLAASGTITTEVTTLHPWVDVSDAEAPVTLWAECTPVSFRSQRCAIVVLRTDAAGHVDAGRLGGGSRTDAVTDRTRAVFTLDVLGRIDSWGPTAEHLTGFPTDVALGTDTTLLHPGPARFSGEPPRALTEAYRNGEHRTEGWRVRGDGRLVWAEIVTCALHDGLDRLIGFATTMHDLTAGRRLDRAASSRIAAGRIPAPRPPAGTGLRSPSPRPTGARATAPALRVPTQRRPPA